MEPAYILHRRVYKESSLLLDVFTLRHGRISVLAKGAYKSKSARGAQLQVFQPLLMDWVGKQGLLTLTKVDVPSSMFHLSGERLYAGYYLNELYLRLLAENDPHEVLFEHYATTLSLLSGATNLKLLLRQSELLLLCEIGFMPPLDHDWCGDKTETDTEYYLSADRRLVPTALGNEQSGITISGTELIALRKLLDTSYSVDRPTVLGVDDEALISKKSVRLFLSAMLDYALDGRAIKSREMLREYLRLKTSSVTSKHR